MLTKMDDNPCWSSGGNPTLEGMVPLDPNDGIAVNSRGGDWGAGITAGIVVDLL